MTSIMKKQRNTSRGFTLIEILVIVAIVSLLVAIVLVSINQAWLKSKDSSFQSTVMSIQRALSVCCSAPGTPLSAAYGGEMCLGGDRYPDNTKMTFVSVSGCSLSGSFTVELAPGTDNAGNCTGVTLTSDGAAFDGC